MKTKSLSKVLIYGLLILFSIVALLPLYYLLITAFKSLNEASTQATMFPKSFELINNIKVVFSNPEFKIIRYFGNTMFVFLMKTTGTVLLCGMSAYAFSVFDFPHKGLIFMVMMSALMIPGELLGIPVYEFMVNMNLRDANYFPLWIACWFGTDIFIIFLFKQFFMSIPKEMREAARIDGASEIKIFFDLILPNVTSVITTVIILYFIGTYNDIYGPTLYVSDPDKRLMAQSIGIFEKMFQEGGQGIVPWNYVAVATITSMLPVILMFGFAQDKFVESMAGVSVKG